MSSTPKPRWGERIEIPDELRSLVRYFTIRQTVSGSAWTLQCKKCRNAWSLAIPGSGQKVAPGSVLSLLNHAMGHHAKPKGGS
jgi:hypothetical protein